MGWLIVRRLLLAVPIIAAVSVLSFGLQALVPGDPAVALAGENATTAQVEEVRDSLGLDDPFITRYFDWVGAALRGDLGESLYTGQSVSASIAERFPVTANVAMLSLLIALLIALPAGILAARRPGGVADTAATVFASIGLAMPAFWLGLLLVLVFSIRLGWLPATGYVPFREDTLVWLSHLILPAVALGTSAAAELMRQLRGSLIEVLRQDYIRTARAKGVRGVLIIPRHALRNAAGSVVTVLGLVTAFLLGGSVVVEQVFALPGLGRLTITAVVNQDLPVIQGVILVATVIVVLVNVLVDVVNAWLNPKVRA